MAIEYVSSSKDLPAEIDCLAVLGKQFRGLGRKSEFNRIQSSPTQLSDESEISVAAAASLWLPGRHIIFSGNKKALFPQAAIQYICSNFPEIPRECFDNSDDNSVNTIDSARNIPAKLLEMNLLYPAVLTVGYHAKRAMGDFISETGSLIICAVNTDDIVAEISPECSEYIEEWRSRDYIKMEQAKESFARRVTAAGRLAETVVKYTRPH